MFWTRNFLLSHSFEFSDSELHNYQQFMWNSPTEHFAHSFSVVEQIIAVVNIMYLGLAVKLPVNTSWLHALFYVVLRRQWFILSLDYFSFHLKLTFMGKLWKNLTDKFKIFKYWSENIQLAWSFYVSSFDLFITDMFIWPITI